MDFTKDLDVSGINKLFPQEFYKIFLENNIRPDGRKFDESRSIDVNFNSIPSADSSCYVRFGDSKKTSILTGIRCEIAQCTDLYPQGEILLTVNLPPVCSPKLKRELDTSSSIIHSFLSEILKQKSFFDIKQLKVTLVKENLLGKGQQQKQIHTSQKKRNGSNIEIGPGKEMGKGKAVEHCEEEVDTQEDETLGPVAVWVLYVDLYCLEYGGSSLDASLLSLYGALSSLKLPHLKLTKDGNFEIAKDPDTVSSLETSHYWNSLNLGFVPIPLTLCVLQDCLFIDPTIEEEDLSSTLITVVLTQNNEIVNVYKPGGIGVSEKVLKYCIDQCKTKRMKIVLETFNL